jgi:hypothetical protein
MENYERRFVVSSKKVPITYKDYIKGLYDLKPEEQLSLMEIISSRLKNVIGRKKIKKHSIMELEGLGADIWKGIDAQKYIIKERKSWD